MRVHRDHGAVSGWFNIYEIVADTCMKNINVLGEYARSILAYMEITPIDIKLSLSQTIFDPSPPPPKKKADPSHLPRHDRMGKKTTTNYCPFNDVFLRLYTNFINGKYRY